MYQHAVNKGREKFYNALDNIKYQTQEFSIHYEEPKAKEGNKRVKLLVNMDVDHITSAKKR